MGTLYALMFRRYGEFKPLIMEPVMISPTDKIHLRRCIELAEEALAAGDEPFGSVLVSAKNEVLAEDRNRIADGDSTRHPEFALARWAAENLTPDERQAACVYTSGEHCPMCAAAHGWVGLGRIVYVSSSEQLGRWLDEWGVAPPPVATLAIQQVVPKLQVDGPWLEMESKMQSLHWRCHHS